MQPLKRFTQCGSLTMLFGVFIVLFGVSSTALTTFGKSNNNPPPTAGPIIKGRDCQTHDDCAAIDKTSCVRDPNDYKFRCLCGDDSPPNNGLCPDVLKENKDVHCDKDDGNGQHDTSSSEVLAAFDKAINWVENNCNSVDLVVLQRYRAEVLQIIFAKAITHTDI